MKWIVVAKINYCKSLSRCSRVAPQSFLKTFFCFEVVVLTQGFISLIDLVGCCHEDNSKKDNEKTTISCG
jgi:hypothetical protein